MKVSVATLKTAGYSELAVIAKKAGIKSVGVKTEDLRRKLIDAVGKDAAAPKHAVKAPAATDKKATPKIVATKKEKETPAPKKEAAKPSAKPQPKAVASETITVSKEHLAEVAKLVTKKEKIIRLNELGYKASVICQVPGIEQHVTNVMACLRSVGLGTGRTIDPKVAERIRATVVAKVAKQTKAK